MNSKILLARTLLLCGALALVACDSTPEVPDGGIVGSGDTGPVSRPDADGGPPLRPDVPDVGADVPDVGPRDADGGPDADTGPRPGCVDGAEGCACTTTATRAAVPFVQEDCQADLVCVSWDLITRQRVGTELDGPVKSCVKPCQQDAECGAGRTCAAFGFGEETGAGRICVDAVAGFDEFCSGSRLDTERVVDPETEDQVDRIIACGPGLACQIGTFGDFFNPDEAICLGLCDTDADCGAELPYCNPRFFASTSTTDPFLGVCSPARLPQGAVCGSTGGQPFRITTACDTSEETCGADPDGCPVCVTIPLDANSSITPDGQGVCISRCTDQLACAGDRVCVPEFFQDGAGACSDQCTTSPESCAGAGTLGQGQDCLPLGDAAFCADRQAAPALAPSTWSLDGQLTAPGDDCTGDLQSGSFLRCPEGASCVPTAQRGLCIFGCTPGDPVDGAALCRDLLGTETATCAAPQEGVGVCGS